MPAQAAGAAWKPQAHRPVLHSAIYNLQFFGGRLLWQHSLPAGPVSWGIAIDRDGRIFVALRDGRILCLAPKG